MFPKEKAGEQFKVRRAFVKGTVNSEGNWAGASCTMKVEEIDFELQE